MSAYDPKRTWGNYAPGCDAGNSFQSIIRYSVGAGVAFHYGGEAMERRELA